MRRALVLVALAGAVVLAAGAGEAGATGECRGLRVCVPIAGPWVVLPHGSRVPRATVEYQLSCPRRFVVGGLDAELSDRAVEVAFLGTLGSPVNPGITTARAVVFAGRYVGSSGRTTSFRPYIGCIPATGGGRRVPTSASRVYPPGRPTIRRVRTVRLKPGGLRVEQGCTAGERLVAASHAVAFYTSVPPSRVLAASVTARRAVRKGRIVVSGHAGPLTRRVHAELQVSALCAGGE